MILALCIRRKKTLKKTFAAVFSRTVIQLKLEAGVWRGSTVLRRFMNTTYCGKAMRSLLRHTDDCYLHLYLGDLG